MKKRFLIYADTVWCGTETIFPALAESEFDLYDLAEQLAYENFQSYGFDEDLLIEEGYDPEEMTQAELDLAWAEMDETKYYSFKIEEFDENDEEWEAYGEPYEV